MIALRAYEARGVTGLGRGKFVWSYTNINIIFAA